MVEKITFHQKCPISTGIWFGQCPIQIVSTVVHRKNDKVGDHNCSFCTESSILLIINILLIFFAFICHIMTFQSWGKLRIAVFPLYIAYYKQNVCVYIGNQYSYMQRVTQPIRPEQKPALKPARNCFYLDQFSIMNSDAYLRLSSFTLLIM